MLQMPWTLNPFPVWDQSGVDFSINDTRRSVAFHIARETLEALPGKPARGSLDPVKGAFDANVTRIVKAAGSRAQKFTGVPSSLSISRSDFDID
jgi:hypothetical protein